MKKLRHIALGLALLCASTQVQAAAETKHQVSRVGVVSFKSCVEQSKLGKLEQETFDGLKKQMEATIEEKEKELNDTAVKFNDPDYVDSLSPEAEAEMKKKFRGLSQELTQLQSQFYQSLNQTNFKIVQKISDIVVKAAEKVAKENTLDIIVNEDSCFFYATGLDITSQVVTQMDELYAKEINSKDAQPAAASAPAVKDAAKEKTPAAHSQSSVQTKSGAKTN